MNNKKLIIGICAIAVVGTIFFVSEKLSSISPPEHRTKLFPTLEERHITGIVIVGAKEGGGAIKLEKVDGVWMVGDDLAAMGKNDSSDVMPSSWDGVGDTSDRGFSPANAALAQIAVERLVSLKKGELVSENREKQQAFGVDEAGCESYVKIFSSNKNDPAFVLFIGRNGPDWNSNYIRLSGSDAVYLASGELRQSLFVDLDRWKQKTQPEAES